MERKLLLITNRKSVIAFQNPGLYLACDATWRTKLRFVTSGLPQNHEKLLITQKRYDMEQKLVLITNIKSVISFKKPGLYFLPVAPPGGKNCVSSHPFYDKIVKNS